MPDKSATLLFIKAPVLGHVKSRLAAVIGDKAALELYRRFVLDAIDLAGALALPVRIFYYPPEAGPLVRAWLGKERACSPQQGSGLGERMERAFEQIFQEGCDRAVLIGSDIPELSHAVLQEAMKALDAHDAVLGPTADGGYYLIGFTSKTFLPSVFRDIAWSTGSVCNETLGRFKQSGTRFHLLPKLRDIDTRDDLRMFFTQHRNDPAGPRRTLAYLIEQEGALFRS
jgi:rSAM/selenodomain-associated transferase 1